MDQVCLKPIGIILTSFIIFNYFIHIDKRIAVSQLEYAANLLQMTDLYASSTVYRFEIIISRTFHSYLAICLHYTGFPM